MSINPETVAIAAAAAAVDFTHPTVDCKKCERPMRPRGVLLKEMPGTMAWGHSGECKSCIQPASSREPKKTEQKPVTVVQAAPRPVAAVVTTTDAKLAHNVTGLNSFLARRNKRLAGQATLAALRAAGVRTA